MLKWLLNACCFNFLTWNWEPFHDKVQHLFYILISQYTHFFAKPLRLATLTMQLQIDISWPTLSYLILTTLKNIYYYANNTFPCTWGSRRVRMKKSSKVHLFTPYHGSHPSVVKNSPVECHAPTTQLWLCHQGVPGSLPNSKNREATGQPETQRTAESRHCQATCTSGCRCRWGPRGAPYTHREQASILPYHAS